MLQSRLQMLEVSTPRRRRNIAMLSSSVRKASTPPPPPPIGPETLNTIKIKPSFSLIVTKFWNHAVKTLEFIMVVSGTLTLSCPDFLAILNPGSRLATSLTYLITNLISWKLCRERHTSVTGIVVFISETCWNCHTDNCHIHNLDATGLWGLGASISRKFQGVSPPAIFS